MDTTRARTFTRAMLNNMMYASTEEQYAQHYANFKQTHEAQFPSFFHYFNDHWHINCSLWVRAWRPDATFDTNNYIESYHNQFKTFYFGRTRNTRVDRIIYILSQVVVNHYRQDALQVSLGTKPFHLTKNEKQRKKLAYDIDLHNATYMIIENENNTFTCNSFTKANVTYTVSYDDNYNYLTSCSCPDHVGLCKHIFLVSRVKPIPYRAKTPISNSSMTSMPYQESSQAQLETSQHNYESTISCVMQKLTLYYDKNETNPDMLDSMTRNLTNFKNMINASLSPNSSLPRQT